MNLLSKLNSSAKTKTIEPREIFMTLPSKAPGYGYPRDVQSEVWKKWFDIRNEKNVILKMNTGSGKTVVGLIMLQSCLNEEKGPAIYVVPDNYLVKQVIDEAKRLGISATVDKDDYNYSNSKAILVTSIQTIVNGHSYFGMREAGNYPIGSIIIDDVHACMDKIIDQFMIKIDAETDAYKELIALFNSSLKDYNPKNYIDVVEMKDCRNEELLMLRALAAKQAQELEASRKIIEERDEKIRKQNIQIDNMIQALLHARKKIFGPSTEVSRQVDGQLSLFEPVQELAEQLNLSKSKITVKPYKRTARQPGVRAEMLAGLPEEIEEYIIPPEEKCSTCGGEMKVIEKRVVRTEVEFRPAKVIVKQIVQQIAKCTDCGEKGSPNVKSHL